MAAEMPVKDVLCEAMDYLSKLGSNLRTRSENLKEKKIRKDKLTNVLAVQKAADKVLLICELSKKSLLNVETGVRKILEHIDVSQASSKIGGKSSNSKTVEKDKKRDDRPKYHYFDYKSRKLRIKNKISLKHYRSIRVLAKRMSTSLIDEHPVYYDCKLYRKRNKEQLKKNELVHNEPKARGSAEELRSSKENRMFSEESLNRNYDKIKSPTKKKTRNKIIDSDDQDDDSDRSKKKTGNKTVDSDKDDNDRDCSNVDSKSNSTNKSKISDQLKTDKSYNEPEPKKRKISENEKKQLNENIEDDVDISDCSSTNKSSSSSKDDKNNIGKNASTKPIIKCVNLSKLLKPDVIQNNKTKPPVTKIVKKVHGKRLEFDVNKKNEMLQIAKKKKEEFWIQKRKEVSAFKPKKFVINITRLPDLNAEFLIKNNLSKIINKEVKAICEKGKDDPDSLLQQETEKSETECVNTSQQNIELMAVSDDPDDELIAQANKIKKSLLCDSDSDNDFDKLSNGQAEINEDKNKKALLNRDSNQNEDVSDNVGTKQEPVKKNENKIKDKEQEKSCLKTTEKSGSDQSKTVSDSEAAKNYLLDKSDSDEKSEKGENKNNSSDEYSHLPTSITNPKTPEKDLLACHDDYAKKSLLCDSSDEITKVPLNQRKRCTPQSKKKRMRESVQAKNDLLRHSSGSETEDEQLKNTLHEIKLSLLTNLSDDENKLEVKKLDDQCKSLQYSSSSAEDLLEIVRKKKSNDSDSSSTKNKSKHRKHLIASESEEEKHGSSNDDSKSTSSSRKVRSSKKKA